MPCCDCGSTEKRGHSHRRQQLRSHSCLYRPARVLLLLTALVFGIQVLLTVGGFLRGGSGPLALGIDSPSSPDEDWSRAAAGVDEVDVAVAARAHRAAVTQWSRGRAARASNMNERRSYELPSLDAVLADRDVRRAFVGRRKALCGGAFEGFAGHFARLRGVVLDSAFASGKRAGGEPLSAVLEQSASVEYLTLRYGFFALENCTTAEHNGTHLTYSFDKKNHLREYLNVLRPVDSASSTSVPQTVLHTFEWNRTAVLLTRNDYANLFQTTADWYDVFLMMLLFQLWHDQLDVLLLDSHPAGLLDPVWQTLWPNVYRFTNRTLFARPVRFRELLWLQQGYSSPINTNVFKRFPFIEEFRRFFLARHNVPHIYAYRNLTHCHRESLGILRNLSSSSGNNGMCVTLPSFCTAPYILVLLRRDYVAHPRNPSGHVSRKVANEEEVLRALRKTLPDARVERFVPTELTMREQLERVARADVLLGMHGAGHTLGFFLPPHAALIELFPTYYQLHQSHFAMLAAARGLVHLAWTNREPLLDDGAAATTWLPEPVVGALVRNVTARMCAPFLPRPPTNSSIVQAPFWMKMKVH